MQSLWQHSHCTPYGVLGVTPSSGISEIRLAFKRMALRTHPDKVYGDNSSSSSSSAVSFHLVKDAATVLLDTAQRAAYDEMACQSTIRSVGAVSDTYVLYEDFELVCQQENAEDEDNEGMRVSGAMDGGALVVLQRECRCGGMYEVVLFAEDGTDPNLRRICECDCCSLVVEVVMG